MKSDACIVPSQWQLMEEQHYANCKVFDVFKRHYKHPSGKEGDFFVIKSCDWVQVIAITPPPYNFVMVQQYRFGTDKLSWEFPGGIIGEGESPIEGGLRELKEETGYVGKNSTLLGGCSPNPALNTNRSHFILVENCELKENRQLDNDEEIKVSLMPIEKVFKMAEDCLIEHPLMINALFHFNFYLKKQKKDIFQNLIY